jgi:signal recognition particle GTPase
MTELIRQQKNEAINKLNKELEELKLEELKSEAVEPEEPTEAEEAPQKLEKPKRPRSEKQIKQFELVVQRKMAEAGKRKIKREEDDREYKAQLEKQLIEKAIKLKKKQINRMKIVEDLSEDETEEAKPRIIKQVIKSSLIKPPIKAPVVIDPYEAFKLKFRII